MPLCILCGLEATEATAEDGTKFVDCPECGRYSLGQEFAADFAKQSDQFRADLARAVPWKFYGSGQNTVELGNDVSVAEYLVADLKVFEEDPPEKIEREVVYALTSGLPDEDEWDAPIMRVSKVLGRSREKSRAFIEGLRPGIVEIITYPTRELEGAKSFTRTPLKQWVRCEKKDSAKSEGSE